MAYQSLKKNNLHNRMKEEEEGKPQEVAIEETSFNYGVCTINDLEEDE